MGKHPAMTELQYAQVRVRDAYRCSRCGVSAQEGAWHHRRGKAVRDEMTHCSCNGTWLCTRDHLWVHANPFEARQLGFIVSRVSRIMPADVPIKTAQYGWVLYGCHGKYEPTAPPSEED